LPLSFSYFAEHTSECITVCPVPGTLELLESYKETLLKFYTNHSLKIIHFKKWIVCVSRFPCNSFEIRNKSSYLVWNLC